MSGHALLIVLFAAVLHASWNAVVKGASDRAVTLAAVALAHAVAGLTLIAFAPPPTSASWIYIFLSTLIHYAYYFLLFQAYRFGDLSQVYPISRGLAPALVAFGAFVLIGESLSPLGWAGLFAISCGIAILAFPRGANTADPRAIGIATVLGITIAAYSIVDGIGIRHAESPMGYIGWLFLFEFPVGLAVLLRRRRLRLAVSRKVFAIGLVGGALSVLAYGLVLYAKTIAPLGAVSAVRESSVIFASLIGLVLFKERPWGLRLFSAMIVGCGVIALAVGG
ncbi:EamA family transporter [Arvimicrobium flavum]|uniref:EamA family transporter n=1 Tax=Arvimicrobium flavum TaxID=3393320 RepID=UPI00237A385D|nr:EamA family transporter [Mesorhizobium shangrilense]